MLVEVLEEKARFFTNLSLNQTFAIPFDSVCEMQTHGNFTSDQYLWQKAEPQRFTIKVKHV